MPMIRPITDLEEYERQQARLDLYQKLAEAEQEIANGAQGRDFLTAAREIRERIFGNEGPTDASPHHNNS